MIELKPGMRVRCIDAHAAQGRLQIGAEYRIAKICSDGWIRLEGFPIDLIPDRFKPIFRVKAPTSHD
jgi:hypothetical protein